MKGFRITIATLAVLAVAAPAADATPLPVESGDADWAAPRVLATGSAASHYTTAAIAAMGARGRAAAAFYTRQQKTTAQQHDAVAVGGPPKRDSGYVVETPGTSEAALDALYGYDDVGAAVALTPVQTRSSRSAEDVARFEHDAALDAYESGAHDPMLEQILGLSHADTAVVRTTAATCSAAASQEAAPDSDAYAAAMEAYRSGAIDPMLRAILGISDSPRRVLAAQTEGTCSTS